MVDTTTYDIGNVIETYYFKPTIQPINDMHNTNIYINIMYLLGYIYIALCINGI